MEAPSPASSLPKIALRPTMVGERSFEPGDKFDADRYVSRGDLTERDVLILERHRFIAPLDRTNYQNAIARRPPGTIGAGFSPVFLRELGIIDEVPAAPAPKPRAAAKPVAPKPLSEPMDYKGRLIVPVQVGRFRQFDVTTKAGELLRPQRFRKVDTAQAFIDELPPLEAADASGVSQEKPEEHADGRDLRSQSGGSGLSSQD